MKAAKPVVVREEPFGLLIWSPRLDAYFLPDADAIEPIRAVVTRGEERGALQAPLEEDLQALGFDDGVRYLDRNLEDRLSAPLDVYFDYTNACNLRCSYCYNAAADRSITMSDERIEAVLEQMSENGIMRTHLAGGEPLIHPGRFETYLRTAERVGMNASVNSNGTIVSDRALDAVFSTGVRTLTFSLDGPDAQVHEAYRGKGSFSKTRENAQRAVHEKEDRGSETIIQYKAVHMFDTPLSAYRGLIEVAIADGMDRVQFHNPECSTGHPKGHYARSEVVEGYYARVEHLIGLQEEYAGRIEIWGVWNPIAGCGDIGIPGTRGCIGGQELIAIDAEGALKPCLMNGFSLGNLFSDWGGSFERFWNASETLATYQEQAAIIDPHCDPCDLYAQCRGGRKTRVVTNNRDGSSFEPIGIEHLRGFDPYCARDYLEKHPERIIPPKREGRMQKHRRIFMAHSL